MFRTTFALLLFSTLSLAQPWQWQQYPDTFWHQPPDLPWRDFYDSISLYYSFNVCGDFNGNGRDEFLDPTGSLYYLYEVTSEEDILAWEYDIGWETSGIWDAPVRHMQALNLDGDSRDELLVFSQLAEPPFTQFVRCYDPDNQNPPVFTETPELLSQFAYPGFPSPSMFGDLEFDGYLDGFTPMEDNWLHYERVGNVWQARDPVDIQSFAPDNLMYVAADLNADGDIEFVQYEPGIDCNCYFGTMLDYTAHGQIQIVYPSAVYLYPGDYDGDGNTESFVEYEELSLPSMLVRLSEGEPYTVTELANQWEANTPFVYSWTSNGNHQLFGIMNGLHFTIGSWTLDPGGYVLQWSDSEWVSATYGWDLGAVFEGNTADIWGDESLERMVRMAIGGWQPDTVWSLSYGNLSRFYNNLDTLFVNPRIGDVEGDNAGELVVRVAQGAPTGLYFYELERDTFELIAHHKPYLSEGLPTNMTEFTLADVDNDGHAELFINTGFWRAFFFRNGHWEEHTDILPPGIGLNLYWADFEGDGDLDAFAQNGVWISLSPSDADEPVLTPSSFSLSVYPNPFNAQTTIAFDLPREGNVKLILFDLLGREVKTIVNERMNAGNHTVRFDAGELASGVYFARMETVGMTRTMKMLLLR